MANQQRHQPSSILLIDHPTRDPPTTRVRSINLNKNIVETTLDTSEVPNFHKYSLHNSCNNLICFAKIGTRTNLVKDSAPCLLDIVTGKLITLPKPCDPSLSNTSSLFTSFYGLGYDGRIENYKILRIVVDLLADQVHNFVCRVQVNTLGDDEWKTVWGVDVKYPSGSILGKPISIHGGVVWADFPQTNVTSSSQRYANVYRFNTDEFSKVSLPYGLRIGHLVGINGQLCAVDLSNVSSIRILVLPDLDGKWENLCTIRIRATTGEKDHRRTRVIGVLKNGKLLFKSYGAYFVYDPATDGLEYLQLPVETYAETEVHCYNEMPDTFDKEEQSETDNDDGWSWIEVGYLDCVQSVEGLHI